MMYNELFSKRLTELRQKKNVSARDMSLSLGQNAGYINNIENKHNLPSMAVFFDICEYFKITPRDFFDFETSSPQELDYLLTCARKISDEDLEHVTAIVSSLSQRKNN